MKPVSAKKEFLRHIRAAGRSLKALSPSEGIALMLEFYRDVRADGCEMDSDGDILLYQWGTYDWSGNGESFEFDITRQLISGDGEDEDIRQLSLTFRFEPTESLRQLGEGNRWCHSLREAEEFQAYIQSSPAFLAVARLSSAEVTLNFGIAG